MPPFRVAETEKQKESFSDDQGQKPSCRLWPRDNDENLALFRGQPQPWQLKLALASLARNASCQFSRLPLVLHCNLLPKKSE